VTLIIEARGYYLLVDPLLCLSSSILEYLPYTVWYQGMQERGYHVILQNTNTALTRESRSTRFDFTAFDQNPICRSSQQQPTFWDRDSLQSSPTLPHTFTMPPRKSDVSKVATGDEGTPAKEPIVREGINIEVHLLSSTPNWLSRLYSRHDFNTRIGPQSSQKHSDEVGERGPTTEYANPRQCYVSYDQECDSFRQLPGFTVCKSIWC
jgi:hypothetical protein